MITNAELKAGFVSRDYPENRKPREAVRFKHKSDPAGRVFLIVTQMLGEQLCNHDKSIIFSRKFAEAGLTQARLGALVRSRLPEYVSHYKSKSGRLLADNIIWNRFHKAYYHDGRPCTSPEHYSVCQVLHPLVPGVANRLRVGTPEITLAEMQELGA